MLTRPFFLAAVTVASLPTLGAAQVAEPALLNLRLDRVPLTDFHAASGTIAASSTAGPLRSVQQGREAEWDVHVVLEGRGITEVSAHHGVSALAVGGRSADSIELHARVRAPRLCRVSDQTRTFAELLVRDADGEHVIPIDHLCLLGDLVSTSATARSLDALADEPSLAADTLADLVAATSSVDSEPQLRRILRERLGVYRNDPIAQRGIPADRIVYVLRPDETLRYGGDCEDWAILIVAVMRRVGLAAHVVIEPAHAYAVVQQPRVRTVIDIANPSLAAADPSTRVLRFALD